MEDAAGTRSRRAPGKYIVNVCDWSKDNTQEGGGTQSGMGGGPLIAPPRRLTPAILAKDIYFV